MAEVRSQPLQPLSPLGRRESLSEQLGPLRLTERLDLALASLAARRGREAEVEATAARLGLPLPGPGRWAAGPVLSAFWTGPGAWMVEAPVSTHEDVEAALAPAFAGAASVTEQTDGWLRLEIEGEDLPRLFERLVNLDLRGAAPGLATRTLLEHIGVVLILRAGGLVTLLGPRSSAGSLRHALVAAIRSAL